MCVGKGVWGVGGVSLAQRGSWTLYEGLWRSMEWAIPSFLRHSSLVYHYSC